MRKEDVQKSVAVATAEVTDLARKIGHEPGARADPYLDTFHIGQYCALVAATSRLKRENDVSWLSWFNQW